MKRYIYILLLLILSSCRESIHKVSKPLLGTIINLTIIADNDKAVKASQAVFNEIKRIEDLMSPYKESSDIYKINKYAALKPVPVTEEVFSLIKRSDEVSNETSGSFDITFASIAHLWNYKKSNFIPPDKNVVLRFLPLVNYKNIEVISDKKLIRFKKKGVKIGLGAIAKGYAVKRGIDVLKGMGVRAGIVEEGGDLQVIGNKFGNKWLTGLMHPRKRSLLLALYLDDMDSIATSGDYERYAYYNNKRYHHIINPQTGYPTETFSSVSVITKDPVFADAYATGIFVMGLDKALNFLKKHNDISVILIDLDLKVYISKKLKDKIKLLEDIDIIWI